MSKSQFYLLYLVLFLGLGCASPSYDSEVMLPRIISEGMVMQRGEILRIWGKGIPGKKVRVTLAGVVSSNTVLEDSTWQVELPEIAAGGPFVLTVNQVEIEDVYIGDVWLAGGQSNMEWPLKSGVIGAEAEYAAGGLEDVRFFKVPNSYSAYPQEDVTGGAWKKATPENMPDFSAVAWFFAKQNHKEEQVPVGIIESNWGGTPAEGWTEAGVLATMNASYSAEATAIEENPELLQAEIEANEKRREIRDILVKSPDSLAAREAATISYVDDNWRQIRLPEANPLQHIAWVRRSFRVSDTANVKLTLSTIEQQAYVYINGRLLFYKDWGVPMPELEIPSTWLNTSENVLTVRAINTWNNLPVVGSTGAMYLTAGDQKITLEGAWRYSNDIVEPQLPKVEWLNWKPGVMYNAMIHPLIKYPIKGAIWYQGESNAGRAEEYRELFGAMIENWRARWGIGDFPFLFAQLANFKAREEVQPESDWAFLRESQNQTLELPNTGMAVLIDIGEAEDIHPRNKKDVGERLWLQAKKIAFGEEDLTANGPVFSELSIQDSVLLVTFKDTGKGLQLGEGEELQGFILGDEQGNFVSAKARISSANQVSIALLDGKEFTELRYAWADNPAVNLINHLGLPAHPFRTRLPKED